MSPALADVTIQRLQYEQSSLTEEDKLSHKACQKYVTSKKSLEMRKLRIQSLRPDKLGTSVSRLSSALRCVISKSSDSMTRAVPLPFLHIHMGTSEPNQHLNTAGTNDRDPPR